MLDAAALLSSAFMTAFLTAVPCNAGLRDLQALLWRSRERIAALIRQGWAPSVHQGTGRLDLLYFLRGKYGTR